MKKNYSEENLLVVIAKKRIAQLKEKEKIFTTIDFGEEMTGKEYKPNDIYSQLGGFLSDKSQDLGIKSIGRKSVNNTTTEVWEILD